MAAILEIFSNVRCLWGILIVRGHRGGGANFYFFEGGGRGKLFLTTNVSRHFSNFFGTNPIGSFRDILEYIGRKISWTCPTEWGTEMCPNDVGILWDFLKIFLPPQYLHVSFQNYYLRNHKRYFYASYPKTFLRDVGTIVIFYGIFSPSPLS